MKKYLIIIIVLLSMIVLWGLAYKFALNQHEGYNSPIVKGTRYILLKFHNIASSIYPNSLSSCPDTKLYDFNQKVTNNEQAISLLKEYFSEEKGFPAFNESMVDYIESEKIYIYGDFYSPRGGILKTNGELIRKGYCK